MNTEVSASYIQAVELNRKIITSAQLAQQSLFDMCMGFKEMRDSKLYKELGYQNFEEYCEQETGFKRSQAYNYISVAENLPNDFVQSTGQIGITKLSLLSTLSEKDRTEITDNTDLESTAAKELERQIKALKGQAELDRKEREDANKAALSYKAEVERRAKDQQQLADRISNLEGEIKELESRPIEVAVPEQTNDERLLKETIKSLERENIKRNEELEEQYRKDEQDIRKMLEEEKQKELSVLKAELQKTKTDYEKKLAESTQTETIKDDKDTFKAYLANAIDGTNRLCKFLDDNENSINFKLFHDKTKEFINTVKTKLEVM